MTVETGLVSSQLARAIKLKVFTHPIYLGTLLYRGLGRDIIRAGLFYYAKRGCSEEWVTFGKGEKGTAIHHSKKTIASRHSTAVLTTRLKDTESGR